MKKYKTHFPTRPFSCRHLRVDIITRLKLLAVEEDITVEELTNIILDAGLKKIEERR